MAFTPKEQEVLAYEIYKIYADSELKLTQICADRLAKGLTNVSWSEQKLSEITQLKKEITAEVVTLEHQGNTALEKLVEAAYVNGSDDAITILKDHIPNALEMSFTMTNEKAVKAFVAEGKGLLKNANFQILRKTTDAYRNVIKDVLGAKVTEVVTRKEATQIALNKFADKGITSFTDKAGRNWNIASYAEMATRTTARRAALQGHVDRLVENGMDLVIISSHTGSCPLCAPWQGKVLSISGNNHDYPSLSQAQGGGLFHPNCGHTLSAYIDGESPPPQPKYDHKEYEALQRQRQIERNIRQWKRREVVAILPVDKLKAQNKIKYWQAVQRDHVKKYDLKRKYDRESIIIKKSKFADNPTPAVPKKTIKEAIEKQETFLQGVKDEIVKMELEATPDIENDGLLVKLKQTNWYQKLEYKHKNLYNKIFEEKNEVGLKELAFSKKYPKYVNKIAQEQLNEINVVKKSAINDDIQKYIDELLEEEPVELTLLEKLNSEIKEYVEIAGGDSEMIDKAILAAKLKYDNKDVDWFKNKLNSNTLPDNLKQTYKEIADSLEADVPSSAYYSKSDDKFYLVDKDTGELLKEVSKQEFYEAQVKETVTYKSVAQKQQATIDHYLTEALDGDEQYKKDLKVLANAYNDDELWYLADSIEIKKGVMDDILEEEIEWAPKQELIDKVKDLKFSAYAEGEIIDAYNSKNLDDLKAWYNISEVSKNKVVLKELVEDLGGSVEEMIDEVEDIDNISKLKQTKFYLGLDSIDKKYVDIALTKTDTAQLKNVLQLSTADNETKILLQNIIDDIENKTWVPKQNLIEHTELTMSISDNGINKVIKMYENKDVEGLKLEYNKYSHIDNKEPIKMLIEDLGGTVDANNDIFYASVKPEPKSKGPDEATVKKLIEGINDEDDLIEMLYSTDAFAESTDKDYMENLFKKVVQEGDAAAYSDLITASHDFFDDPMLEPLVKKALDMFVNAPKLSNNDILLKLMYATNDPYWEKVLSNILYKGGKLSDPSYYGLKELALKLGIKEFDKLDLKEINWTKTSKIGKSQIQNPTDVPKAAKVKTPEELQKIEDLKNELGSIELKIQSLPNKTYPGIWVDEPTIKDYSFKKGSIQAKKDYFNTKITNSSDPDKFKALLAQLEEFEEEGKKFEKEYLDLIEEKNSKTSELHVLIGDEEHIIKYSQERKDAAHWFKTSKPADNVLRPRTGEIWRSMTGAQKDAAFRYTSGSGIFNRPLRGYQGSWNNYKGVGKVDLNYEDGKHHIEAFTKALDKSTYDVDMWLQRGIESREGVAAFLGISESMVRSASETELKKALIGKVVKDHGFVSAAASKGTGFSGPLILNIYAPKGTKMIYAEPFSHYGNGNGRSWNGIDKQSSFGHEFEVILQRGYSYKVTKVTRSGGGTIYVDIDVLHE